jgi:hypothetical protein
MWNFKKKKKTPEQKDFVIYKNYKPARIVGAERRGKKTYLLLAWTNLPQGEKIYEKWVKASECIEYTPSSKEYSLGSAIPVPFSRKGKVPLNWWQKLIVKLQNWYYGRKD